MMLQELFNKREGHSVNFKSVTPDDISITDDELEILKGEFLRKKCARINSANYAMAVNSEPVYKKPTYIEVYQSLIFELTTKYKWDIDEYNELPLKQIAAYFSGDKDFEIFDEDFNINKALLLFGPVGCGKTTVLKVLSKNSFNPFRIVSCRKIADEYAEFGHSAISEYSKLINVSRGEFFGKDTLSLCCDDLGTENIKKNFGNEVNVMSEIILNRYDNIDRKNATFVTTNLTTDQMKEYYGERAASRMREMFNLIEFPFDGPDRRK